MIFRISRFDLWVCSCIIIIIMIIIYWKWSQNIIICLNDFRDNRSSCYYDRLIFHAQHRFNVHIKQQTSFWRSGGSYFSVGKSENPDVCNKTKRFLLKQTNSFWVTSPNSFPLPPCLSVLQPSGLWFHLRHAHAEDGARRGEPPRRLHGPESLGRS